MDQSHVYHTGGGRRPSAVLLRDAVWMAIVLGAVSGTLLLVVTHLLQGRIFDTTPLEALILTSAALPSVLLHNYLTGIVIGQGWFRYYGRVESCKWTLHVILLGALAATGTLGIESALLALYAPIGLAGCVHLGVLTRRTRVRTREALTTRPEPHDTLAALGFGARACAVGLGQVLHQRLDVYLVKYLTSASSVGLYALAANIADVILYGGRSVGLVVFARRAGDADRAPRSPAALCRTILFVTAAVAVVVLVTGEVWIGRVFGERYLQATDAVLLRLPGIVAESGSLVLVGDFLGCSATASILRATALAIAGGLALNLGCVPFGGIAAAAAAFSCASWVRLGALVRQHAARTATPVRAYLLPRHQDVPRLWAGLRRRGTADGGGAE
jgi:O-antigen/teichoic acid export membrane protein